jgi:hypothetical protein
MTASTDLPVASATTLAFLRISAISLSIRTLYSIGVFFYLRI